MEEDTKDVSYPVSELAISFVDKNGSSVSASSWSGKDFLYGVGGYASAAQRTGGEYTLTLTRNGQRGCFSGTGACQKLGFSKTGSKCLSGPYGVDKESFTLSSDCWTN